MEKGIEGREFGGRNTQERRGEGGKGEVGRKKEAGDRGERQEIRVIHRGRELEREWGG
jgi:hypothetical protein